MKFALTLVAVLASCSIAAPLVASPPTFITDPVTETQLATRAPDTEAWYDPSTWFIKEKDDEEPAEDSDKSVSEKHNAIVEVSKKLGEALALAAAAELGIKTIDEIFKHLHRTNGGE